MSRILQCSSTEAETNTTFKSEAETCTKYEQTQNYSSSSSSKFYFQQNTTMEQYQEKENTL